MRSRIILVEEVFDGKDLITRAMISVIVSCDLLRLYAKSLNYRYVDVTPTLAKMQISKFDITIIGGRSNLNKFWKYFDHRGGELRTKGLVPMHGL
jgi:hypothetical protein